MLLFGSACRHVIYITALNNSSLDVIRCRDKSFSLSCQALRIQSRFWYNGSGDPHSFGGPIRGLVGAARRVTVSKNRAGRPMDTWGYLCLTLSQSNSGACSFDSRSASESKSISSPYDGIFLTTKTKLFIGINNYSLWHIRKPYNVE